jgi:hypothetical protein
VYTTSGRFKQRRSSRWLGTHRHVFVYTHTHTHAHTHTHTRKHTQTHTRTHTHRQHTQEFALTPITLSPPCNAPRRWKATRRACRWRRSCGTCRGRGTVSVSHDMHVSSSSYDMHVSSSYDMHVSSSSYDVQRYSFGSYYLHASVHACATQMADNSQPSSLSRSLSLSLSLSLSSCLPLTCSRQSTTSILGGSKETGPGTGNTARFPLSVQTNKNRIAHVSCSLGHKAEISGIA